MKEEQYFYEETISAIRKGDNKRHLLDPAFVLEEFEVFLSQAETTLLPSVQTTATTSATITPILTTTLPVTTTTTTTTTSTPTLIVSVQQSKKRKREEDEDDDVFLVESESSN